MIVVKKKWQDLLSLNGLITLTFSLLVLSIPMQYRFHKIFRGATKAASKEGMQLPIFFETFVHYCISDVFIFLLLVALMCKKMISLRTFFTEQSSKYLSLYFLITIISLIVSKNSDYILQYIRLGQLVWVGILFYLVSQGLLGTNVKSLFQSFLKLTWLAALFECGVAILQYFTQHTVGLKKLGEINFSAPEVIPSSIGISDGSLWIFDHLFSDPTRGERITRAYGTLPDPNLLGGYLVFSLIGSFYLFLTLSGRLQKTILSLSIFIQFFALFITYSRSAFLGIFLGSVVFFSLHILKTYKEKRSFKESFQNPLYKRLCLLIVGCFASCMLLFYPQLLQRGGYVSYKNTVAQASDDERVVYQEVAANIIQKHPLTGVGFNNYVLEIKEHSQNELPHYYCHPVHNIFLLIASETGLLGLLSFCVFITGVGFAMLKKGLTLETIVLTSLLVSFLFIGCCSHYLLTWQPGRLMFFMLLGFIGLVGRKARDHKAVRKENYSEVTI